MRRWRELVLPRRPGSFRAAPPGLHAFTRQRGGAPLRLHLRVEGDGSGLLLAAASEAVRLSAPATAAAHALLAGRGRIEAGHAAGDDAVVARIEILLQDLGRPDRLYPVFNLDDPALAGGRGLLAPFEADVVLAPDDDRVRQVLGRLWRAGVPHVRFRVPVGTLHAGVARAVERAEDVGLITGLRIGRPDEAAVAVLGRAVDAGLDHVTVSWPACRVGGDGGGGGGDEARAAARRLLRAARELETCPVAEIPLVAAALPALDAALADLREAGVENAQVWAIATEDPADAQALQAAAMRQAAAWTEERADLGDVRVTWAPPARRDPRLTLAEQVARGPRAGSDLSVRVEQDGSVLPPRGASTPAGSLLEEDWATLWGREAFRRFRERVESDTRCDACPGLALCAADCPADPRGWSEP
jgi:radical SAM protein with 4Fe4S-binding SPASM domain